MKIVFFGTPPFAAHVLSDLLSSDHEIVAVVTRTDKPKGRSKALQPSAVKEYLLSNHPTIPLFQPERASTEEFANTLKALQADCFVVVAYGEIIKKNLLDIPKYTCINTHASILPKYRGAAPIQRAIMKGESETGVTIMEMVEKMDAGDIFSIEKVPIDQEMNAGDLENKLQTAASSALLRVLKDLPEQIANKQPQQEEGITFAPKITIDDRLIRWNVSSQTVHDQIRGLAPRPGAFCEVEIKNVKKRLMVKRTKQLLTENGRAGETLHFSKKQWVVACGSGAVELLEVQLEGKKSLPIEEFLRGYSDPILIVS